MTKINLAFVNVEKQQVELVEAKGNGDNDLLELAYDIIDCQTIDMLIMPIHAVEEGCSYHFVVDDEGLFKENPKPTVIVNFPNSRTDLLGNVCISKVDNNSGASVPLNLEDIEKIKTYISFTQAMTPNGIIPIAVVIPERNI